MLGAQLQVSHKLFTFLHTRNIEMCVLGNNMNQGKRWNNIGNIMGRKKSKPQLNASPPLLPNQRTNRSPLNSSNYLKDNQRLFTRQSRRKKHYTYKHTLASNTRAHAHTQISWLSVAPSMFPPVADMHLAQSSYIKTCQFDEQKVKKERHTKRFWQPWSPPPPLVFPKYSHLLW